MHFAVKQGLFFLFFFCHFFQNNETKKNDERIKMGDECSDSSDRKIVNLKSQEIINEEIYWSP
jgi:hypothetical protein